MALEKQTVISEREKQFATCVEAHKKKKENQLDDSRNGFSQNAND